MHVSINILLITLTRLDIFFFLFVMTVHLQNS